MSETESIEILTSQIDHLKARLEPLESTVHEMKEQNARLLRRLERAVRQAAERGDTLAQNVQADNWQSLVENLAARFEATGKQEPQTQ